MMEKVILHMPEDVRETLWAHLLPPEFTSEETAFMFVQQISFNGTRTFSYLDWYPVPVEGYVLQSAYHFELTDDTRAKVIKKAHDLNASLIEFHSHDTTFPVQFSATDFMGFQEFVPHVWWRLKGRPYLAIVVAESSFDGLAWIKSPVEPQCINGISSGNRIIKPTSLSFKRRHDYYE
jgi:hypothetical protein